MEWMIAANSKIYRHADSFAARGYIDWRKNAKYSVGDTVYIYCTKPNMKIMYKTRVTQIDIPFEKITDDKEYWINIDEYTRSQHGKYVRLELVKEMDTVRLSLYELKQHGLRVAPQGPMHVNETLVKYIEGVFNDYILEDFFEEIQIEKQLFEGTQKTVIVNKYERSSKARDKCVECRGCYCHICGLNFEKVYGKLGENFIHVHHLTPLSEINDLYEVDPEKDLIPICPNCHAMIHRKLDGKNVSVEQLKRIYEYYKKINKNG